MGWRGKMEEGEIGEMWNRVGRVRMNHGGKGESGICERGKVNKGTIGNGWREVKAEEW